MSALRPRGPCTYSELRGGVPWSCPRSSTGHGRCLDHARADRQRFDQQRGTAAQRGYDAAWRRIRETVLHDQPWCVQCQQHGRLTEATDVHHAPPYPTLGPDHRAYQLTPLCKAHHSAITTRQVR